MRTGVLKNFRTPLPFWGYKGDATMKTVAKGDSPRLYFEVYNYSITQEKGPAKDGTCLLGIMPSTNPDTCIVVVAAPFKKQGPLDYHTTVSIATRMFAPQYESQSKADQDRPDEPGSDTGSGSDAPVTPEQIQAYKQTVFDTVKAAYKHPSNSDQASRCEFNIKIGADGQPRIEQKLSSAVDSVDKSLQKAILAKAPFAAPPGGESVEMNIVLEEGELSLE